MSEKIIQNKNIEQQYLELTEIEPQVITALVPRNAEAEKLAVISGQKSAPEHEYDRLNDADYEYVAQQINQIGQEILDNPDLSDSQREIYRKFIGDYDNRAQLLQTAKSYNQAQSEDEKQQLAGEYMRLNIEIYGEPEESTYRSLLNEKLAKINDLNLAGQAAEIRDELMGLVEYDATLEAPERFRPSEETVAWVHDITETLYGGLLDHIPDQDEFDSEQIQSIFEEMIFEEFGEAANGWQVVRNNSKSINVQPTEKTIYIPESKNVDRSKLRKLVVHEIGVHFLRSITGSQTDLPALSYGLDKYSSAEEGLGVVMEQALEGKYSERGVGHYITAGLAYFDDKQFSEIYEINWRLAALSKLGSENDLSDDAVSKARSTAYDATMRIERGTDELPLFKDLSYYNGAAEIWQYLEDIRGDDFRFSLFMQGRTNTSLDHSRAILNTVSVG